MVTYYNVNGAIIPSEKAVLPLADLATLRGYGIFDYFLFKNQQPLFINDYLDRFFNSAHLMHLELPMSKEELRGSIQQLIIKNGLPNGSIRLLLTGGCSLDGYTPTDPNLAIMQYPEAVNNPELYQKGIKLLLAEFKREIPTVKTINYLNGIRLIPELKRKGAVEPLYFFEGHLLETVRSNVFIVTPSGTLMTPNEDILMGITRKKVIEAAREMDIRVQEGTVTLEDLKDAAEVFITGSNKKVMPVTQVDEQIFNRGIPGPVYQALADAFEKKSRG